jgi:hypothetical protein
VAVSPPAADAPRADAHPGSSCPRCGAPHDDDQEYCLECGIRLPQPDTFPARLGVRWRRRVGWYPGDWLWPALVLLLLAAGGAGAAVLYASRSEPAQTLVATSPPGRITTQVASTRAQPTTQATSTTAQTTAPATTAPPPSPPPPPKQTKPIGWPAGRTGYTVVLASVPTTRGRATAVAQAQRAINAGLTQVGILQSSSFSTLHPGYYVIFSGVSPTQSGTAGALTAAQGSGYAAAYVREVSP